MSDTTDIHEASTVHSANLEQIDFTRLYRTARATAAKVVPVTLSRWAEDVVQEVVMAYVGRVRGGVFPGRQWFRWEARDAMRRILGDERTANGRREDHVLCEWIDEAAAVIDDEPIRRYARGLCMRRLRDAWESMTPHQRAGLYCWMTDSGTTHEVARQMGTTSNALINARGAALRRINEPVTLRNVASRPVRSLPLEERRAYYRGVARRRRARQALVTDRGQP